MSRINIGLDEELVVEAKIIGLLCSRPVESQLEYWATVGKLMEQNPDLSYAFVKDVMNARGNLEWGLIEGSCLN
ncbi:MAG: hypothetical protein V7731_22210 [Amphritea sp.]